MENNVSISLFVYIFVNLSSPNLLLSFFFGGGARKNEISFPQKKRNEIIRKRLWYYKRNINDDARMHVFHLSSCCILLVETEIILHLWGQTNFYFPSSS